jgi:hypothetical protein
LDSLAFDKPRVLRGFRPFPGRSHPRSPLHDVEPLMHIEFDRVQHGGIGIDMDDVRAKMAEEERAG